MKGNTNYEQQYESEKPPLPDDYLKLYLEGNTVWPQMHLVNSYLIGNAALKVDSTNSLEDLLQRQIDKEQFDKTVKTMNRLHENFGIDRTFSFNVDLEDRKNIGIVEIETLWQGALVESADRIVAFAKIIPEIKEYFQDFTDIRLNTNQEDTVEQLQKLDTTLQAHPESRAKIAELMTAAVDYMRHSPFKDAAETYRSRLAASPRLSERIIQAPDGEISVEDYTAIFSTEVSKHLRTLFPDLEWENFSGSF